jgi:hypothetical protein
MVNDKVLTEFNEMAECLLLCLGNNRVRLALTTGLEFVLPVHLQHRQVQFPPAIRLGGPVCNSNRWK